MDEPIRKSTGQPGTRIQDTIIQAVCETKALADSLDTLQSICGGDPPYAQIIELYQRTMLTRTELSEMLTDHLIDQRNRVSL